MYIKKWSWWSSFKQWIAGLYLVTFAFAFIGAGVILLLLPSLNSTVWQTIGGALLGTGFTILVTSITARQSSLELYRKEANLQRKIDVYGPLHAELKLLRETFDNVHAGTAPYPIWIEDGRVERPSSVRYVSDAQLPKFHYWPDFKTDYRVDNFSPDAQKLLNNVQNLAVAYGEAVKDARKTMKTLIRPHIAASISKEAHSSRYQEWLSKRPSNTQEHNRWFDFIYLQMTASSTFPLGEDLSLVWSVEIGWLLADNAPQAALNIYNGDARQWDASQHSSLTWFQDIFEATASELKSEQCYQKVQDAQKALFTKLLEAEKMLYQGLIHIRDRYEGGPPPV